MKLKLNLLKHVRPATVGSLWRYYWDPNESTRDKVLLPLAVAYVVIPVDVVPEAGVAAAGTFIAGPLGFVLGYAAGMTEDAFLLSWAVGKLDEIRVTHKKPPRKVR